MKTLSRLIRRHVAAAFVIVLLVFAVNAAILLGVVVYYGSRQNTGPFQLSRFAASFAQDADGRIAPDEAQTDDRMARYAFAMLLGDDGEILWQRDLPLHLNHRYTSGQIAAFTRWYLDDHPIFVYRNDFGLLVAGMPKGSVTRFDFYLDSALLRTLLQLCLPLLILDGALILAACLLLSFRAARGLLGVGQGIDALADGGAVELDTGGMSGELAEKLNALSSRLAAQSAQLARRDSARTGWIAGVSHDIRTPLSLILGYAEQIGADPQANAVQKERAAAIARQSQRIRTLIEDLNLTSKLQYDAQPLRAHALAVGPFLRQCAADFVNSGPADHCTLNLCVAGGAGQTQIVADGALLHRALTNLLANSAQHNPGGCTITLSASLEDGRLTLCVSDDGAGYPQAVLRMLHGAQPQEELNAPHILGLHLVEQIARAHGASAAFLNQGGACCRIAFDTCALVHV